jgi:hypothetical protein
VQPFDLVTSDVAIFGLQEPSIPSIAVGPNNVLAYQMREIVQTIMQADRSYWAR